MGVGVRKGYGRGGWGRLGGAPLALRRGISSSGRTIKGRKLDASFSTVFILFSRRQRMMYNFIFIRENKVRAAGTTTRTARTTRDPGHDPGTR